MINDGAIFSLQPNNYNINNNEIFIGQLTINKEVDTNAIFNIRGKNNNEHMTFDENTIFNLKSESIRYTN